MAITWHKDDQARLPAFYLAFTLPLLATIALITPPWQNPDEPLHMARIVQIAHGELLAYRAYGTAGGQSDRAIYDAYRPVQHAAMHPEQRLSRASLQASNAVLWSPALATTSFPNTAQYPPMFYLPGAAAYWAGRAGGLSIDRTLLLVRLVNATLFATLTATALTLARGTRPLLLACLLLPTTLGLACAAGQDSLLMAATALAVSLIDRISTARRPGTRRETLLIAALLISIACARPPYAGFLLALLLLDPKPTRRTKILLAASATLVLAWCATVALHVSVKLAGADMPRQLAYLHNNPGQILPIAMRTIHHDAGALWAQFIGVLGWADTPMPRPYMQAQSVVLLLAALASHTTARPRSLAAAGICFAISTIFILQYLTWSWPGQNEITGVLGRYFIAPAFIAALALPWPAFGRLRAPAYVAILLVACATPAIIIHAELFRYYVTP
jgi:uncharacterized membrane protein